jgi:glycine/serine hydroxymethyltransferase
MQEPEMKQIAKWILEVVDYVKNEKLPEEKEKRMEFIKSFRLKIAKDKFLKNIALEVRTLCKKFPTP